jgi:GAF domain-containing protein
VSDDVASLRAAHDRLKLLYQVSNVIHSTLDPQQALQLILREAVRLMRASSGSLCLIYEKLKCQIGISRDWGGRRRSLPYAFTEQGVAMLSSVLSSPRAVQVNIAIMRAFVRLRELLLTNADLARKLAALEAKYDSQFKVVFDAIRQLMTPPDPPRRRIGFHPENS